MHVCFSSLFCLLLAGRALADEPTLNHPLEPAVTTSPKATLKSFLESFHEAYEVVQQRGEQRGVGLRRGVLSAAEQKSYRRRVFSCLDLSQVAPALRPSRSLEAAAYLKEVLDRIELPPESEWPDEAHVAEANIERWIIPHTEITIGLVKEGSEQGEYLFTPATVDQAAEFYERVRHLPHQDRLTKTPGVLQFLLSEPGPMLPRDWIKSLPQWFHFRTGGQAIWQWIGLLLTLLVSLLLLLSIYLVRVRGNGSANQSGLARNLLTLVFLVAAMLIPLLANYFINDQLRITGNVLVGFTCVVNLVFLFTLVLVVLGVVNRIASLIISTPWVQPRGLDAHIVRLTCRVLGITAAIIILLEGGQQIGIPLTTLVAGAGVSGLALALAAQDMLKNVFGSIMISLDKPYRIGERIRIKGYDGVVEEVGLRSTKIRTLTGHQTSIPNEEMARSDIENIGRRPYIRRDSDLPIPLDTPPEKIDRCVEILRTVLENHEGMVAEFPPRVYFDDFNRDSFNIRMSFWYHPPDYWDYLAFCNKLNRQIVTAFAIEGIRFAPPTTATFVSQNEAGPLQVRMLDDAEASSLSLNRSA